MYCLPVGQLTTICKKISHILVYRYMHVCTCQIKGKHLNVDPFTRTRTGASKQLGTIIEGESLLNDGCAIVIFNVFMKSVVDSANNAGLDQEVEEASTSMALMGEIS